MGSMQNHSVDTSNRGERADTRDRGAIISSMKAKQLDQEVKQRKREILMKPFLLRGILREQNVLNIDHLYPSVFKKIKYTDLDKKMKEMNFPIDYLKNENNAKLIARLFLDVLKQLQVCEIANTRALKDPSKLTNPSIFCYMLFERNEFSVYTNILKNFLLKLPLWGVDSTSSGVICGEIISLIHKMSEDPNSRLSIYRRKFVKIASEYIEFISRLTISMYCFEKEKHVKSSYLEISQPVGLAKIYLTKLMCFLVKGEHFVKGTYLEDVNETTWDTFINWFFRYKSSNLYTAVFLEMFEAVMNNCSRDLVQDFIFRLHIVSRLLENIGELYPNNILRKKNGGDLASSAYKKVIGIILKATKVRVFWCWMGVEP